MTIDTALYKGSFKIRQHPAEWSLEEWRYWWIDERDSEGRVLRKAAMSQREKDRYNVVLLDEWGRETEEIENLITNSGITTLLTNASVTTTGAMIPFCQILEVGSGAIGGVARTDTATVGALTPRKAPTGFTITGTQTDVAFSFSNTDAVATWTNVGLWGTNATTTAGTGTMDTHALFNYNHTAVAITFDYFITVTN